MKNSVIQIGNFSYFPDKVVGQGATGSVFQGFRNQDRFPVAIKVIRLKQINTQVKKHLLDCEVSALRTVKNRYVCQAYDILKDSEYYFVPQEYYPNGTLRSYVKSKVKLSQTQALSIFSKILEGYIAIKQAGFIHRDLKSDNILLRGNNQPAIIDFGYCQIASTQGREMNYNVGSPAYMSPEAYNNSIYSEKSDIWALGIVFHEMLTGTIPIMRTNDVDEYFRYLKTMRNAQIVKGQQNPICTKLLEKSLTVDPKARSSAQELKYIIENEMNNLPFRNKINSYNPSSMPLQKKNQNMKEQKILGIQLAGSHEFGYPVQNIKNLHQKKFSNWNQKSVNLNTETKSTNSTSQTIVIGYNQGNQSQNSFGSQGQRVIPNHDYYQIIQKKSAPLNCQNPRPQNKQPYENNRQRYPHSNLISPPQLTRALSQHSFRFPGGGYR